ncbi:CopD family protein [Aquisalimonas sp.]|uniref:CopD family protein n=1 Tax=unclassified Aquisalimonas TaxID=2644645 RepID=UPI0025C38248|nr:CopD family protein [Aquisalimonas sp.]
MLWVLVLHIVALLFWSAALLYLPALVAAVDTGHAEISESPPDHASLARFVHTHVATPAALVAIMSGTLVFLLDQTVEVWLMAKLTLVTGMVICHAFTGLLILRAERGAVARTGLWAWLLAVTLCLLMAGIVWLVLAKPTLEGTPWAL